MYIYPGYFVVCIAPLNPFFLYILKFDAIFEILRQCIVPSQKNPWESFRKIVVSSATELCQKKTAYRRNLPPGGGGSWLNFG